MAQPAIDHRGHPHAGPAAHWLNGPLFCLAAALLATLVPAYQYGLENQTEHLLVVFRAADPQFLSNDFFVNATSAVVGPRYYYAQLLAAAARMAPLPLVYLLLTFAAKLVLVGVTYAAARRLSRQWAAAVVAVALTVGVMAFNLGNATLLLESGLEPALLVRGMALGGLWLSLEGRQGWALALALATIPIHPLVGFETAAVGFAAAVLAEAVRLATRRPKVWRGAVLRIAIALSALAVAAGWLLLLFGRRGAATLSTAEFIHILAECRAPHHYLPSAFGGREYALAACFAAAAALAWWQWRREGDAGDRRLAQTVLAANLVILALLVGGYVFVEMVPSRLWTTAQTFRLLYVTKWLGFLLLARTAARAMTGGRRFETVAPGWFILAAVGPFQPLMALGSQALIVLRATITRRMGTLALRVITGLWLLVLAALLADGAWREAQTVALVAAMGLWYIVFPWRGCWPWAPPLAAALLVLLLAVSGWKGVRVPRFTAPAFTLEQADLPYAPLASLARRQTPSDSVFLVPPEFGSWRLLAERAIVVDWKVFPFHDQAMAEWYARMRDCYGSPLGGRSGPEILDQRYRQITESRLMAVGAKHGASYAVLYQETPCRLPVAFAQGPYKVVRIGRHSHLP